MVSVAERKSLSSLSLISFIFLCTSCPLWCEEDDDFLSFPCDDSTSLILLPSFIADESVIFPLLSFILLSCLLITLLFCKIVAGENRESVLSDKILSTPFSATSFLMNSFIMAFCCSFIRLFLISNSLVVEETPPSSSFEFGDEMFP